MTLQASAVRISRKQASLNFGAVILLKPKFLYHFTLSKQKLNCGAGAFGNGGGNDGLDDLDLSTVVIIVVLVCFICILIAAICFMVFKLHKIGPKQSKQKNIGDEKRIDGNKIKNADLLTTMVIIIMMWIP